MDKKSSRKIARKLKHCEEILFKHENIKTSKKPSKNLFVGNGGMGCGVSVTLLEMEFSAYGILESIVMVRDKPYAFVVYREVEDARRALNHMNGQRMGTGHVFYLAYLADEDVLAEKETVFQLPKGLILIEDFITEEDEKELLDAVNVEDVSERQVVLRNRTVKHYGYEFIYGSNNINKEKCLDRKIPDVCLPHLQRLVTLGYLPRVPDQLTVNHYLPGQGIPRHIDTHSAFEDGIVSISLESQVVMEFYCPGEELVEVLLPRRSALIMLGESRYRWKHGISCSDADLIPSKDRRGKKSNIIPRSARTSLTFRLVRQGECDCNYIYQCDSQNPSNCSQVDDFLDDKEAEELEKKYVNQVYERIADHFSDTRYKPWPKVASFLGKVVPGSMVLDVGCGNGKNLNLTSCCFEVGCDASTSLARLCSHENAEVVVADCLRLPFRTNCVDVVICIAVIHHMSTKARRIDALREIVRVLQPGGQALVYVWAFEQESSEGPSNYLKTSKQGSNLEVQFSDIELSDCEGLRLPLHENRTNFVNQDVLVPWKEKGPGPERPVHHRYYHVFREGELEEIVVESGASVLESFYDKGNWCVVLRKDSDSHLF